MISARTGPPGDSARRTMASGVTRDSKAPLGNAISTSTERRAGSVAIRRTVPGTMLCRLIASGALPARITSRAGMRTRRSALQRRVQQRHPECRPATFKTGQLPAGIVLDDAAQQQRAGIVALRQRQIGACGDLGQRAAADHMSRIDQHHRIGKLNHLVQRMRHIDDRQPQDRLQPRQIGQDFRLARRIQAGQRFIHQQQMRLRKQGATNRHALALTAGQRVRPARQQRADAQQFDHFVEPHRTCCNAAHAEAEIGGDRHMREQFRVLKHQTDAPSFRRQPYAGVRVGQHQTIDRDAACVGTQQTGRGGNDRGFAGPRRSEQHRHARCRNFKCHVHLRRGKAVTQPERKAHRPSAAFSRLPIHSDSSSPISASVSDTSDSCAAFASPPGTCSAA